MHNFIQARPPYFYFLIISLWLPSFTTHLLHRIALTRLPQLRLGWSRRKTWDGDSLQGAQGILPKLLSSRVIDFLMLP
jgi:hypothetical protein